jgi:DNA polymerase-3 subunit beta
MKLETFKDRLRQAVGMAERITGKNLSLPVLALIVLEARERNLVVRATNLDVGVEISLPAKVGETGGVAVSGSVLGSFLANLNKDDKVTLETVNNNLAIATTHTQSVITTQALEDFPSLPRLEGAAKVSLPVRRLVEGLKAVSYAASLSDIKPEIASVYLYQDGGDLFFVATDSFRLAEKRIVLEQKLTAPLKLIIPIKNVQEIIRVLESESEEVEVSFTPNQVSFACAGVYLTSRLVDGIFPDYRQIMPTASETQVVALKPEVMNALKLAVIFSDKLNQVTLKIDPKASQCEIYSRNGEVGENTTKLEATIEGEAVEANYNVRYILDCFQSLNADSVAFELNGRNRPLALSGVGDGSFRYLVMPLNR